MANIKEKQGATKGHSKVTAQFTGKARSHKQEVHHVEKDTGKFDSQGSNVAVTTVKSHVYRGRKAAKKNDININVKFHLASINELPTTDKIILIKRGFSKDQLEEIKENAHLDYDTLSSVLSVSRAKLINKKGSELFDQSTSERIMLLADLISYGQEVFDDKEQFNTWLKKPNKALGMKKPIGMMDTVYGLNELKKELGRIEYGVF
jgi:putative toxin-antitoxin system antitoxin component (TIGR02293 family)